MRFWNFVENEETEEVELRIEGDIVSDDDAWFYEWFGIQATSPNAFRKALAEYKGRDITIWIDSYGGDVFAGTGIYIALKEHKGFKTVKIGPKAMSAATIPAMAGDKIYMTPGSIFMIHNPWTGVYGDMHDMRHAADILDEVRETIVNAYQLKTGKSRNKLREMMDNETWMSAKTAKAEGFCDDILYIDDPGAEPIENSFMYNRMAINNTATDCLKRFIEQYNKFKAKEPPVPDDKRQAPLYLYEHIVKNHERRFANEFKRTT